MEWRCVKVALPTGEVRLKILEGEEFEDWLFETTERDMDIIKKFFLNENPLLQNYSDENYCLYSYRYNKQWLRFFIKDGFVNIYEQIFPIVEDYGSSFPD